MSSLGRYKQKVFGEDGATGEFGEFGSDAAGTQVTTKNPDTIQSLDDYYGQGLFSATDDAANPPMIEDINGLYFLFSRQIAYIMQAGICEWQEDTDYYEDVSIVLGSDGGIYISASGDDTTSNSGNDPTEDDGTNWTLLISKDGTAANNASNDTAITAGDGLTGGGTLANDMTLAVDFEDTASNIEMNGTASVGSLTTVARADHVHPIDTSRAPKSHASSGTTYGVGTTSNYGHCKLTNALTDSSYASGKALSAYQGYVLNQNKAPTSHASSSTTYGVGTTSNYGHVKLINALTSSSYVAGQALSAYQGYLLDQNKLATTDLLNAILDVDGSTSGIVAQEAAEDTDGNSLSGIVESQIESSTGNYIEFSNGLVIEWGKLAKGSNLSHESSWTGGLTLPLSVTAITMVQLTIQSDDLGGGPEITCYTTGSTITFEVYNRNSSTAISSPSLYWLAFCYLS